MELTPEIDINNLRFYAAMARAFKWHTDIIDWRVIETTLTEIAGRYDEFRTALESERKAREAAEEREQTALMANRLCGEHIADLEQQIQALKAALEEKEEARAAEAAEDMERNM
jgi:hypothetical protein